MTWNKITWSTLRSCCYKNDIDGIQKCLDFGININERDHEGETVLLYSMYYYQIDIEVIKFLISKGANMYITNNNGGTVLMAAAFRNSKRKVEYLISLGMPLEQEENNGFTAMTWAGQGGNIEILKILLDAGAKIDSKHRSALTIACGWGKFYAAAYLIAKGADVNFIDKYGSSVFFYLFNNTCVNDYCFKLLLEARVRTDIYYNGEFPIHSACTFGKWVVKRLIDYGVDLNVSDKDGNTPLHIAVQENNSPNVKLLLKNGCDPMKKNNKDEYPMELIRSFRIKEIFYKHLSLIEFYTYLVIS